MKATARTRGTRSLVYGHIKKSPWSTAREIAGETGLSESTVRRHIKVMLDGQMIQASKKSVRQNVSAMSYARAGLQELMLPKHTCMIGNGHYEVDSIQMKIGLEGEPGSPEGIIPFTRETMCKYTLRTWGALVVSRDRLDSAHGLGPHHLTYFDSDERIWFAGWVELADHHSNGCNVYSLKGIGKLSAQWV